MERARASAGDEAAAGDGARSPAGRWRAGRSRGAEAWNRRLAALSLPVPLLLTFHALVPNAYGHWGSLLETFLPWLGVAVPPLLLLAALRRSAVLLCAALLPAFCWAVLFGPLLVPRDGSYDFTVVQHNVSDVHEDPARAARELRAARGALIAVEELTPSAAREFDAVLAGRYPYHAVRGTVGLWSRYPLSEVRAVDIRPDGFTPGWRRALRATAALPQGEVAVYVAHLPSVRLGAGGFGSAPRDESAGLLGAALSTERLSRVLLLGDLNATVDDRGLDPVLHQVRPPRSGFAPSWPARLPLARIDQVLARSATVVRIATLPDTGSDHLPVVARIRL